MNMQIIFFKMRNIPTKQVTAKYITRIFIYLAISTSGFPDRIETYALISGLFTSLYSAGAFIGPSVGGAIAEHVSFRGASIFPLSIEIAIFVLTISHFVYKKEKFLFREKQGYQSME